jgi:serine/threonine protein kinase
VFLVNAPYIGGGCFVLLLAFVIYAWYRRRMRRLEQDRIFQAEAQARLQKEIQTLNKAFEIKPDDIALHELIDEGGNGEVWRGTLWGDRTVVVKRLKAQMRLLDDHQAEFQNEVEFLRTLRHPHIVYFFGFGLMLDTPFFVTEFMARGSLRKVLDEINPDHLPWPRRIGFALDGAKGMKLVVTAGCFFSLSAPISNFC